MSTNLKVQGHLLTEGILDAILARVDEGMTEFDIIGREEELMYELAENIVIPLELHKDFLKPLREVIVTIEPEGDDTRLGVRVKMVFEDGDIHETREVTLDVVSFDLSEIYGELFLSQIDDGDGGKSTVVYSGYRCVLSPSDRTTYVEFDGRLYNVSRYCEEYKKLEKEIDEDESRLLECLYTAADYWWNGGGLDCLMDYLDSLRFADNWHVQHYKGKYWYAFLVMDSDIVTTGDVFGGERIYAPFTVDIPVRLLSDAVKQDITAMKKIFAAHLCAIGCDAVAMFEDAI